MWRARGSLLGILVTVACVACGGGEEVSPPTTVPVTTPSTVVQDGQGASADGDPLLVWADCDEDEGEAPLSVKFLADVEGGKPPLKYVWTFGDGSADSSEPNPTHVYEKAGYYQAELIVTDAVGDEDSDFLEIEVLGEDENEDATE
jgi:PKD repeat protein